MAVGIGSRLRHQLFDTPISPEELARLSRLLRLALADTQTDGGFERLLCQMVQQETALGTQEAWLFVRVHLEQYRRGVELSATPRSLAQRFLADPPLPSGRGRRSSLGAAKGGRPGLIRLAMIYLVVALVLCLLGRACLDRAFPSWSWTDPRPLSLPQGP